MPTYSYRCRDCGVAFDIQQAFSDDTLTECPQCHGSLRKLFNTVGVVFKGSGFYRTDSRASTPSSESTSPSSSATTSSESKKESSSTPAASSGSTGSSSGSSGSSSSAST